MITLTLVVCSLWLLVALYKFRACSEFRRLQPKPRPTIMRQTLSDKEDLIVVTLPGYPPWVGTYRKDDDQEQKTDWYRSLTQRG